MKKTSLFERFGLDKKTEQIYRALLALADAPASAIAKRAGIKRTSAYHILGNLADMGLVTSYRESGVERFVAQHPSMLKTYFERQAILAERLIPELEAEIAKSRTPLLVEVFEGKEAIQHMTESVFKAKEKTVWSIGSTKKLLEFIGGKYGFGKRRRAAGIFEYALRYRADDVRNNPASFHKARLLPDSFAFPGKVTIFDSTICIVPFSEPPRGIQITDPAFAQMMRSMFDLLWSKMSEEK